MRLLDGTVEIVLQFLLILLFLFMENQDGSDSSSHCSGYRNNRDQYGKDVYKRQACHIGTIATGDQFIHEQGALEKIRETFGASACEMEGGSIGQVCYLNQVPFAVIRAISDNADDESHIDYREFVGPAAQDSIQLLCRLLERLNS